MSVINPPGTPLIDARGLITPPWYRFLVAIQKNISDANSSLDEASLSLSGFARDGATSSESDVMALPIVPGDAGQDLPAPVYYGPDIPDDLRALPVAPDPTYRAPTVVVATDLSITQRPSPEGLTVRHTGTLTADRTVTLAATTAQAGTQTLFTRTGSGAFNLSIGGLKNLTTGTWALVEYDGAAWFLAAYGAL